MNNISAKGKGFMLGVAVGVAVSYAYFASQSAHRTVVQ